VRYQIFYITLHAWLSKVITAAAISIIKTIAVVRYDVVLFMRLCAAVFFTDFFLTYFSLFLAFDSAIILIINFEFAFQYITTFIAVLALISVVLENDQKWQNDSLARALLVSAP